MYDPLEVIDIAQGVLEENEHPDVRLGIVRLLAAILYHETELNEEVINRLREMDSSCLSL